MASCAINFKYDVEKFVNAVTYFASKELPGLDKLKISKLLYFADKIHLQKYGRPITGDDYGAWPYGPVPTASYGILGEAINNQADYFGREDADVELFLEYLDIKKSNRTYPLFKAKKEPYLEVFSESELETLEEVVSLYGALSGPQLIDKTHMEKAWLKARKQGLRHMDYRLFLEDMTDDQEKQALLELLEMDQEDRDIFED